MNRVRPVGLVCIVVSVVLGAWVAISRPKPDVRGAGRTSQPATSHRTGASLDLAAVVRRVHFSFRPEGKALDGGDATYAVVVDGTHVRVRPATYRAEPASPTRPTLGASLDLETTAVRRDSTNLAPRTAPVVDERGHSVRRGEGVSEELENRPGALEQSWHFATRPAGSGDVTVRVRATGLAFGRATTTGLHFTDSTTRLGIRYGHATWIDARGTKTAVPVRWSGSEIAMTVPARVVDASAYPAVLDPLIGPEQGVDVPVIGPSGSQIEPSVAYSGTEYFVVWKDSRESSAQLVFGTRVSGAGDILDPYGIAVSPPSLYSASPSVVWDGTNYLVVFAQIGKIVGRRFDKQGAAVDAEPFAINDLGSGQYSPVAASNGSETLVVWYDGRNAATTGWDIYGTRVVGSTPLDGVSSGMAIETVNGDQFYPRVAYGGGNWLVAWEDHQKTTDTDVYAARIKGSTGTLLDTTPIPVSTGTGSQSAPWLASDGTDFLVVWYDDRNNVGAYTDVYGARIASTSGALEDASGIQICNDVQYQTQPSVAFNGGSYQVVWEEYRGNGLYGNRVAPDTGALLDGGAGKRLDGGAVDVTVLTPRIFATGGGFYLVWNSTIGAEAGTRGVYASRFTTGQVIEDAPGKLLASSANGQTYVDLASNGADGWFVVWRDDRNATSAIYGARIDSNGTPIDSNGILLSEGGVTESMPSVAYNGTNWLVAWADSRPSYSMSLYGTRVDPTTGAVLDPAGIKLTSSPAMPLYPQIASDGSDFFITWTDYAQPGLSIYGGRVDGSGVPLDGRGIPISRASGADSREQPEIAYGGGTYLVVWSDKRTDATGDFYGARVSPTGVVQEAQGIAISTASASTYSDYYGVVYAGTDFTVAWAEDGTLMRGHVNPATGAVSDIGGITPVSSGCCLYAPSLAFDGTNFLAAYSIGTSNGYQILGTRFAPDGTDLDATDFFISGDPGITPDGVVLSAIPGKFLAAYTRYDPTPGITADRLRLRTIASNGGAGGAAQGGASGAAGSAGSTAVPGAGGDAASSGGTSSGGTSSGGASSGGASAGGTTSTGGSISTAGSVASGGEPSAGGANAGAGVSAGNDAPSGSSGGCATRPTSRRSAWPALVLLALAFRRRRRTGRHLSSETSRPALRCRRHRKPGGREWTHSRSIPARRLRPSLELPH